MSRAARRASLGGDAPHFCSHILGQSNSRVHAYPKGGLAAPPIRLRGARLVAAESGGGRGAPMTLKGWHVGRGGGHRVGPELNP